MKLLSSIKIILFAILVVCYVVGWSHEHRADAKTTKYFEENDCASFEEYHRVHEENLKTPVYYITNSVEWVCLFIILPLLFFDFKRNRKHLDGSDATSNITKSH